MLLVLSHMTDMCHGVQNWLDSGNKTRADRRNVIFFSLQLSHSNTVNNETCAGGRWRWRAEGVFFTAAESGKGGRREKFCSLLLLPLLSHPSIKILLLLFLFLFSSNVTQILGDLERGGRRETQVRHALLLSSNLKPNFTNIFPQKSSSASMGSFKITSSWFRLRFALFHTLSQTDPRRKVHFQLDLFPKPIWGKRGHRRRIFSSFFLPSLSIFPGSKKRGGRRKRRCNLQQYNWCSGWGKGKAHVGFFTTGGGGKLRWVQSTMPWLLRPPQWDKRGWFGTNDRCEIRLWPTYRGKSQEGPWLA